MKIRAHHQNIIMEGLKTKEATQRKSDFGHEALKPVQTKLKKPNEDEFDEEKSHNYFLEALMEFRNLKNQNVEKKDKKVCFKNTSIHEIEEPEDLDRNSIKKYSNKESNSKSNLEQLNPKKEKNHVELGKTRNQNLKNEKKPFSFYSVNEENWTNLDPINFDEKGVNSDKNGEKFSCWECLKVFKNFPIRKIENRFFCAERCFNEFKRKNLVNIYFYINLFLAR
jgi:hypothetical protein